MSVKLVGKNIAPSALHALKEALSQAHSSGGRLIRQMDRSDVMAVLENRIDLVQLQVRKRRKIAQKGHAYLIVHEILTLIG